VYDYTGALRDAIAKQLGVTDMEAHRLAYADPISYGMDNWPGFPDAFRGFHTKAVEERIYRDMPIFPQASEYLWKLSDEGHHIRIITSRFVKHGQNHRVVTDTGISLDNSDIPYRDIMFTALKVDIFADVYIDDSPKNIELLKAAGRQVIIYDAPYNRDFEGRRAHNWPEVYAHLHEIEALRSYL
jgi:5'(3')-deoxyribonucleotidase